MLVFILCSRFLACTLIKWTELNLIIMKYVKLHSLSTHILFLIALEYEKHKQFFEPLLLLFLVLLMLLILFVREHFILKWNVNSVRAGSGSQYGVSGILNWTWEICVKSYSVLSAQIKIINFLLFGWWNQEEWDRRVCGTYGGGEKFIRGGAWGKEAAWNT